VTLPSRLKSALRWLFLRKKVEHELDDDIQSFVELSAAEKINDGMTADEARRLTMLELGGTEQIKERIRTQHWGIFIDELRQDLRYAFRTLGKNKGWTAVMGLSLALGIGADTVVFSEINSLLLTKLAAARPDELVKLEWAGANDMVTNLADYGPTIKDSSGQGIRSAFSYALFKQFQADNQTLNGLFAEVPFGELTVVAGGQAERASSLFVSGNYYEVLGVLPLVGRTLIPDDDVTGRPVVAVLSYGYWTRRFGADPSVINRVVTISNVPTTIVGVTPPGFNGAQGASWRAPDMTMSLTAAAEAHGADVDLTDPTYWSLQIMGRLKPDVTREQVRGNLAETFRQTAQAGWQSYLNGLKAEDRLLPRNLRSRVPQLRVESGSYGLFSIGPDVLRIATILGVVVVLVLLIVCANVANLLLSRAAARQREISTRLSLGASRPRIIRQLLTESALISGIGGALGLCLTFAARSWIPGPPGVTVTLDWRVFVFTAALSLATGITFGLVPALQATRLNLAGTLSGAGRSIAQGQSKLGNSLIVVQVAISLVLLVSAGLFIRTLENLRRVDVGFDAKNLLTFEISPDPDPSRPNRIGAVGGEVLEKLRALPNVLSASMSDRALLSGHIYTSNFFVLGRTYDTKRKDTVNMRVVSPGFFETMGIPLIRGRSLLEQDGKDSQKVAVINEAAARKYFPNENPIGNYFGTYADKTHDIEIVGVARDTKYSNVRDAAPPTAFICTLQNPPGQITFELRTSGNPDQIVPSVRNVVHDVDPMLPIMTMATQQELIEERFQQERVFAIACSLFGAIAIALVSIGLFGLLSYNVARRTNEIGVRMALGAQRSEVLLGVLRDSLALTAVGSIIGLAGSLAAGRLIAGQLYGLAPDDPLTMVAAIGLLTTVAALAGFWPARRASLVDPIECLRAE